MPVIAAGGAPRLRVEAFGPYSLAVARDAAVAGEHLPLVAISHGTGGTPWTHRDLASALAGAGFGVLLVAHAGDC